jgi:selT/selW/selH-like putative selenoprotein
MEPSTALQEIKLPRVVIVYCTQCRWMLRAAYFAQELLSTFGTRIGEICLVPATGGIFTVHLTYNPSSTTDSSNVTTQTVSLWDRKAEGGFPETKVLKQRLRDHIDPHRNLGHSDVGKKAADGEQKSHVFTDTTGASAEATKSSQSDNCEDCK